MSAIAAWTRGAPRTLSASPALVLFMAVFTSQAGVLVLSPILVEVARDLDVSTAAAGQLRVVAAPVAAVVAILVASAARRLPLHSLLRGGTALVAAGSVASAAAPSFVLLALAQVPLWIGVALLVVASVGAAGSWSAAEGRSRLVAHALAGAPAAWVVGMPVTGLIADVSWRLAFVAVPLPAAVVTGALLLGARRAEEARTRVSLMSFLRERSARAWAFSEFLAMSSWSGVLVFSGVLFIETHGASTRLTGVLLATLAVAYLVGNWVGGRIHSTCLRRTLARANVAAAVALAATWLFTPNIVVTLVLFSVASSIVSARNVAGTAYGFTLVADRQLEVGAARAAMSHAGYLVGAALGGVALALGGNGGAGLVFGLMLAVAALPYAGAWRLRCGAVMPRVAARTAR